MPQHLGTPPSRSTKPLRAGADLDLRWKNVGHPLTYEELEEARDWLSGVLPTFS